MEHDVFISHTSEDKEDFVEPLVNALREAGLNVWYDRFELKLGDSLRAKIDQGLARVNPFISSNWKQCFELVR